MEGLTKQRVLVVGMARSGIAAAALLAARGALPILNDRKTEAELGAVLDGLRGLPCQFRLGEPPIPLLDDCDMLVISPGVPIQSEIVRAAKARGLPVLGELELAARCALGMQLAITGTNGKTTTTTLVGEILRNAGKTAHVVGNIGAPFSTAALVSRPEDYCVIEVSSFQLESTDRFHPHVAALLNITPDHLNRHGTMEAYIRLKAHVMERQTASDFFIFNADDPLCACMGERAAACAVGFSRKQALAQGAFVESGQLVIRLDGTQRTLCAADEVRIPGPHNLENALAASAMAICLGVPAPVVRHTLRTFAGVEHRIETVRVLDEVTYINDSKGTNVDSTLKAIETMCAPTVLIAGGDDKGVSFAALAEAVVHSGRITDVVLIGKTADAIGNALEAVGFHALHPAGYDFERALTLARGLAPRGGNVLLSPACASFDMFEDYEQRGEIFKRIVCGW